MKTGKVQELLFELAKQHDGTIANSGPCVNIINAKIIASVRRTG